MAELKDKILTLEGLQHFKDKYMPTTGLTEEEKAKVEKIVIDGTGDKFLADNGEYKELNKGTTVTVNGEGENSIVQSMELGKDPNIAAGRSDVVFGRYTIGDSRTLNADGSVKSKGDGLFVAGVQNKNYGNRSAQFGSYNENHSLGSFQAGYSNKIFKNTEYATQFGSANIIKHNGVFQTGGYNISGCTDQFQAGKLAKGSPENIFEVGGGGRFVKSARDDSTLINDSYYIRTSDSYEKITADNIDSIPSTTQVYYLKNLFEINIDGTAKIAKQGDSENSLVIKKTLDNYKPIDAYEGTAGLAFTIISEEEKTCEVSNGSVESEEIIIPPYVFINGTQYTVTSIKNTGFNQKTNIKSVVIPETVTKIGNQAFDGCTNLVNIKIPKSVVELGSSAFQNCDSLEEIEIPDSVTTITPLSGYERALFNNCSNLRTIILGKGITRLPYQCFVNSLNLTDIIIKGEIADAMNELFSADVAITVWTKEDTIDNLKKLFGDKYPSVTIKGYKDELELNKYLNSKTHTTVTVNGEAVETFNADTKVNKLSSKTYAQVFYQYSNSDGSIGIGGWKVNGSGGVTTNNDYGTPKNSYTELKRAIKDKKSITDFSAPCGYVDDKTALYQHYVTLRGFAKLDNGEFGQQEDLYLYPKLRSAKEITLENFYEMLSNEVIIGEYLGIYLVHAKINNNNITICYEGDGTIESWDFDVTAQTEDFYWEIDDAVPEIETQGA